MQKRLEKAIKELAKINGDNLVKSDENTVSKVIEVFGENMPLQLKEWYSVYNGGFIGQIVEFYSTDKLHKGFSSELFTLKEMNDPAYKRENSIEPDLACFATTNDGMIVGYDLTEKSEAIYLYDIEEDMFLKFEDMADFIENEVQNYFLMEDALEIHFRKVVNNYIAYNNSSPKIPYSPNLNKELLLTFQPDEDGEVEWQPIRINEEIDLYDVEEELGFPLFGDLPQYYTTFLFFRLDGYVNKRTFLNFHPISSREGIKTLIKEQFKAAQEVFPNSQIFLLGMAVVINDDNYGIYYDNTKNNIFLYNPEKNKRVKLGNLSYIVATMY